MKRYEVFTKMFSKLIRAEDAESARVEFEKMFEDVEIIDVQEYTYLGSTED